MPDLAQRLGAALCDRYRVERELGRGGMATVFLAHDTRHGRSVAIKVLDPEVAQAVGPERFLREIETVAKLTHPHVLPLFDSGEAAGLLYYVMPFVEGESLRDRLAREKQLPLDEALRLTREIASALEHAHAHGIVHRDIKPENVLLQDGRALVADFGVARAVAADGARLTATGIAVGTPAYMSPEQAAGGAVDARADVYALGCVLYELLAGQPPYLGPTAESVLFQHLNAAVPKVTALRPALPAGLDRTLAKAMAKAPADRYGSVGELLAGIEAGLADTTPEGVPARRSTAWAASAVALGAVLALVAVSWWQSWGPFAGRTVAPGNRDQILVAEFDSAPDDTLVANATHDLLAAALDQSRVLATVPRELIVRGLRAAGKPPTTRVSPEVARDLAYRLASRAVLEGKVGRLGPAYSIVLRLVDADTARVIRTETAVARNDDALVPTVANLAKRLRTGMGESRAAVRRTRSMQLMMTPSLEALKLLVQSRRAMWTQISNRTAIRLCRRAVGVDPDFAAAWAQLAGWYTNLGFQDSALACIEEALRRPERLSPMGREVLLSHRAYLEGDISGRLAAVNRILADDPNDLGALHSSIDPLLRMGRFKDAYERQRRVIELTRKVGPNTLDWMNLAVCLRLLGRFDEAREAITHQTDQWQTWHLTWLEVDAGRFAVAESIATRHLDDARINEEVPGGFLAWVGTCQFARGSLGASAATTARIAAIGRARGTTQWNEVGRRGDLALSVLTQGAYPMPAAPGPGDTSLTSVLGRGLRAVAESNLPLARRCLQAARSRPSRQVWQQGAAPLLLEAQCALLDGRPAEAVRLLRPLAPLPCEVPFGESGIGLTWPRWTLADAFERLGQPDSAAACLERQLSSPAQDTPSWPLVHRRLAILYAKLGRLPDAQRHLAAVERMWDRPDPAARRMLEEARAALRVARSMVPPERRGT